MADHGEVETAPPHVPTSGALQIAVLAGLAAMGTLATNILLPQMALALNVISVAVTSAITVFLAVFAFGQLLVGPIPDRWPVLVGFALFFGAASGAA